MKNTPDSLFKFFNKYNKISREAYDAIVNISTLLSVKKNNDLQPIGHTCRTIYFIAEGAARLSANHGIKIELCCTCTETRGLNDVILINQAEVSTMKELTEMILESDKVLTI